MRQPQILRPRRRKTKFVGTCTRRDGESRPFLFFGCNISSVACVFKVSMKTIKLLNIATAAAIAACALTAKTFAADTAAPARGQILQHIVGKLNLTDDQKSQIKTALGGEKDALKNLLGQLHDARKNLRAAIQAGDANETSVRAASAKVASAEADLAVERMKLFGKIAPILTDEQRRQISDFMQRADDFADNAIARIGDGLAQ